MRIRIYYQSLMIISMLFINLNLQPINTQIEIGDILDFTILKSRLYANIENDYKISTNNFIFNTKSFPEKTRVLFYVKTINEG